MPTPTSQGTHPHARTRPHTDKYVILIAFSLQQWFRERASMLRYTYIAFLLQAAEECVLFSSLLVTPREQLNV